MAKMGLTLGARDVYSQIADFLLANTIRII